MRRVPRALQKTRGHNKRGRTVAMARLSRARQLRDVLRTHMNRERGVDEFDYWLSVFRQPPLHRQVRELLQTQGACQVLEIGSGHGNTAYAVALRPQSFGVSLGRFTFVGMDVVPPSPVVQKECAKAAASHPQLSFQFLRGDAVLRPFPKSDIIVSQWTLGYAGHPLFLVKKAAGALKANGWALLGFNSRGKKFDPHEPEPVDALLIRDLDGLEKKISSLRLPRTRIRCSFVGPFQVGVFIQKLA